MSVKSKSQLLPLNDGKDGGTVRNGSPHSSAIIASRPALFRAGETSSPIVLGRHLVPHLAYPWPNPLFSPSSNHWNDHLLDVYTCRPSYNGCHGPCSFDPERSLICFRVFILSSASFLSMFICRDATSFRPAMLGVSPPFSSFVASFVRRFVRLLSLF